MDMKQIFIITIAVVIAIIACSAAYSAQQQDNVIEIDNMQFNASNVTKFIFFNNLDEDENVRASYYFDEDDSGYTLCILNCSEMNESDFDETYSGWLDEETNESTSTYKIDGIDIYSVTANQGNNVGDARFSAYKQFKDMKAALYVSTPDANETAKIISTFEFI